MVGNLSAMAGKMDVVRPVRHAENWRKGIRSREDRHSEDEGGVELPGFCGHLTCAG